MATWSNLCACEMSALGAQRIAYIVRFWVFAMYVCTEAVHTYIAKRASSPMYGLVLAISPFTNRSKSGCKSEPFRNACKNFLNRAAAAGLSIPLFRRQQKAGSLCFCAQTASFSLSLMLPHRGTLCAKGAGQNRSHSAVLCCTKV